MIQFKYPQWIWTFYVSRDYRNFVRFDKINVCCHRHAKNWKLLNEFKTSARAGKRMLLCVWVSVEANQSNIAACFHSTEFSLTPLYNENRRNKTFISYKIEVVSSKYHDLLNSSRWPVGSSVRKFYKAHKRQSRKQLAENRSGFFLINWQKVTKKSLR